MTLEEKMEVLKTAKDLGLASVKIGDVEYILQSGAPAKPAAQPVPDAKAEELLKPLSALDDLTTEEILYWATPYYDELKAQKELRQQQRKDGTLDG